MTGEWIPPGPPAENNGQSAAATPGHDVPAAGGKPAANRRLVLTPAIEIQPEPVVWAWEDDGQGRVPSGSLGLFAGREGTGKSSFLIRLAAQITTGTLPGSLYGQQRAVIYVAVEDSWKHTIVPRLIAAGADLTRVYRAEVQVFEDDTVSLSLPTDNKLLENAITDNAVAMVALDPLMSAISDTLDTHVNRQVRQALDPLARLADRTGVIVAGIAHFNKSSGTDASSLITASGAFKDVARFIFAFATDEEAPGTQGVITQTKNSLGLSNLPSLAYRMTEAIVPTTKGDARVGRLVLDGPSDKTVRDILGAQADTGEHDDKVRAEDFLRKALADGPRRTKDVEEEAREAHSISKRSLERARTKMGIPARQRESGLAGREGKRKPEWWISLPEHQGDLHEEYAPSDPDRHPRADRQDQTALTRPDRQTAKTATPPGEVAVCPPAQTATLPGELAVWRSGGLRTSEAYDLGGLGSGAAESGGLPPSRPGSRFADDAGTVAAADVTARCPGCAAPVSGPAGTDGRCDSCGAGVRLEGRAS